MQFWADLGSLIETYATITALIVGGIWTYRKFIKHRTGYPIIKTELTCTQVRVEHGWIVRADVVIENVGITLAKPGNAELRLRQIVPLPDEVAEAVAKGYDPVGESESSILWPCLAQRSWRAADLKFEIEPGESGALHADFFVPEEVTAVELYFFLANPKKSKQGIGWSKSYILEFGH